MINCKLCGRKIADGEIAIPLVQVTQYRDQSLPVAYIHFSHLKDNS